MQNDGKTTVSLGLIAALAKRFPRIGFIKPIGQRYLMEQGYKVDEDSVLIEEIFGIKCNIKDMSPIAIERGFTERYIEKGCCEDYAAQIRDSFERIAKENDLVIIEGTGHAGVGSVFDLSNAAVAKLLGAEVILISSGGVGKPIDEVSLNKALFDAERVKLAGVIVNKVLPEKYDRVARIVTMGLEKKGFNVLGVLPYQKRLATPTMREVMEELKLELMFGGENLDVPGEGILVGAMEVESALRYFKNGSIIVTPGDRPDIIGAAVKVHLDEKIQKKIAGIIVTGGILPDKKTQELLRCSGISTLISSDDTYSVASRLSSLSPKLKPHDHEKIKTIVDMVEKYVAVDKVISHLS